VHGNNHEQHTSPQTANENDDEACVARGKQEQRAQQRQQRGEEAGETEMGQQRDGEAGETEMRGLGSALRKPRER
jgi:hypothetical protein